MSYLVHNGEIVHIVTLCAYLGRHKARVSSYRDIVVEWDEDTDPRVLDLLDEMPRHFRRRLLSAAEHEGTVHFNWDGDAPAEYVEGTSIDAPDGDVWSIV